jgi:hypothetical protein
LAAQVTDMLVSPEEDWEDVLHDLGKAIKEGRLRYVAWIEHKPPHLATDEARYTFGAKGFKEAGTTMLRVMNTNAAIKACDTLN